MGGWVTDPQVKWLLAGLVHLLGEPDDAVAAGDLLLDEGGDVVTTVGSLLDGNGAVLGRLHTFLNLAILSSMAALV